jgi:hypothetical protein
MSGAPVSLLSNAVRFDRPTRHPEFEEHAC